MTASTTLAVGGYDDGELLSAARASLAPLRPTPPTPGAALSARRAAYSPAAKETASVDACPSAASDAGLSAPVSASQTSARISLAPATRPIASTDQRAIVLALWGLFGWAFPIVQQARLVTLDPAMAPITLSLNISALYIGVAIGSSLGAWTIARWSVDAIGLVAGASEILALVWLALSGALKLAPAAAQGQASTDAVYFAPGE